jgi:glycerophosphoryl diester phosphodiesterase
MQIISHRGYWDNSIAKNSKEAFVKSFKNGFGIETDLRDLDGDIIISHDMPLKEQKLMTLQELLEMRSNFLNNNANLPLALNIKSDGLQNNIVEILNKFEVYDYFIFDMSIPDHIGYLNKQTKIFTRQSEYEKEPAFYKNSIGVWLDAFNSLWYDQQIIESHLSANKKVSIVSFELHKRDHINQWGFLKTNRYHLNNNIILCTDFPTEAKKYFYE